MDGPIHITRWECFVTNIHTFLYKEILHENKGNVNTWWKIDKELFPTDEKKKEFILEHMDKQKLIDIMRKAVKLEGILGYETIHGNPIKLPIDITFEWFDKNTTSSYFRSTIYYQIIKNLLS